MTEYKLNGMNMQLADFVLLLLFAYLLVFFCVCDPCSANPFVKSLSLAEISVNWCTIKEYVLELFFCMFSIDLLHAAFCSNNCKLKVIPLKLFYYQTFFETWLNEHS